MGEKRKARRYRKRYRVRYGETDFTRTGFSENISASGMFVITSWMPKLGTNLCLEVTGLDDRRSFFHGEVKRLLVVEPQLRQLRRGGFGVRFLGPGELLARLVPTGSEEQVVVPYENAADFQRAFAGELSQGGLVVYAPKPLSLNGFVQVQFQLKFASELLEITSRVVQVGQTTAKGTSTVVVFQDKPAAISQLQAYLPP